MKEFIGMLGDGRNRLNNNGNTAQKEGKMSGLGCECERI